MKHIHPTMYRRKRQTVHLHVNATLCSDQLFSSIDGRRHWKQRSLQAEYFSCRHSLRGRALSVWSSPGLIVPWSVCEAIVRVEKYWQEAESEVCC